MGNAQQALLWGDDIQQILKKRDNFPLSCREAAERFGTDNLSLEQIIGLLLDCSRETAERLAERGISGLIKTTDKEFLAYKGVGPKGLLKLRGAFSILKKSLEEAKDQRPVITSPEVVSRLLMPTMRYLDREYLKVILLDTQNRVIDILTVSIGGLDHVPTHPREVFNSAIRENAKSIILVHNHPSGEVTPSQLDIENTNRMIEAGKIIGIDVLDHVIIGDGKISSFKELGLM